MSCRISVIWLVLGMMPLAQAGDELEFANAGAAALAEGKRLVDAGQDATPSFLRALQFFQQTPNGARTSPGRHRNIGNAAYLAGDLPLAVRHFRLGLMYDPHDSDLRAGLVYLREQVQYPPGQLGRPEPESWPAWLPRLGSGAWLSIAIVAYVMGCWTATAAWLVRNRRWAAVALLSLIAAAVAAYGWSVLDLQRQRDAMAPPVVIRADGVGFFLGNGPRFPRHAELPTLRRGMEARRLAVRGDWWQLQFANGQVGWIDGRQAYAATRD